MCRDFPRVLPWRNDHYLIKYSWKWDTIITTKLQIKAFVTGKERLLTWCNFHHEFQHGDFDWNTRCFQCFQKTNYTIVILKNKQTRGHASQNWRCISRQHRYDCECCKNKSWLSGILMQWLMLMTNNFNNSNLVYLVGLKFHRDACKAQGT